MIRRFCSALLTSVVLASFTGCSLAARETELPSPVVTIAVDGPVFDSVQDLAKGADAIVSVRITASRSDVLLPSYEGTNPAENPMAGTGRTPTDEELQLGAVPITVHDAVVVSAWEGLSESATIEIVELGDSQAVVVGQPDLPQAAEGEAILFLAELADGRYEVLGQGQGILIPAGSHLRSPSDGHAAFDITIQQLEDLLDQD
ncbi:MAG: hypothetical protein GX596_06675 [Propionibacterium sp.]|nr:hypothetical protein [Propionibacterium sp.]